MLRKNRRALVAWAFLSLATLLTVVSIFVSSLGSLVLVVGLGSVIAIAVGGHQPGADKTSWNLGAGAATLALVGMGLRSSLTDSSGLLKFLPDLITVPAYALFLVMFFVMFKRRKGGVTSAEAADVSLFALAIMMTAWVLLVAPQANKTLEGIMNIVYPAISVCILFMVGLLALARLRHVRSFQLFLSGSILLVGGDVSYAVSLASMGESTAIGASTLLYSLAFVFYGTAALHPSAPEITEPIVKEARLLKGGRQAFVAFSLLVPPLVLIISPARSFSTTVGAVVISVLMVLIVGWRMRKAVESYATSEERLTKQATHDALTGLPNKRALENHLEKVLYQAKSKKDGVALLFCDLDGFKAINDTWGHSAGDQVLKEVAARLNASLREGDLLARPSGDEFLVVLSGLENEKEALRLSQRVLSTLNNPTSVSGTTVNVFASVGVSYREGEDLKTSKAEDLVREADTAMYVSKGNINKITFFDESMRAAQVMRLELESELREALDTGTQLELHYQPILDLKSEKILGFEALSRWSNPKKGMISPLTFIPIAEDSGLILKLGRWSVETAIAALGEWRCLDENLTMSVNFSARQLADKEFIGFVGQTLSLHGVPASALTLEITESFLFDVKAAQIMLQDAKDLGIRLSADDFGTGYSSLSYLRQFPVDQIKVDKSFVDGLGKNKEDEAVVAAVVSMAHALGLNIVAEGIETYAQKEHLKRLRCQKGQGFFFAKPQRASEIENLLFDSLRKTSLALIQKEAEKAYR